MNAQNIKTEQLTSSSGSIYYKAWVKGKKANYSLGSTSEQAVKYLQTAIKLRGDF